MKRVELEAEAFLTPDQVQRIREGRTVVLRIGEEHDGHQLVIRFSHSRDLMATRVAVKYWAWDHGGDQITAAADRPAGL